MPKFDIFIKLPRDISDQLLPIITANTSAEEIKISRRVFTRDSLSTGSVVLDVTVAVVSSSSACLAITNIITTWIKARNSKSIKLKHGSIEIEATGLTQEEVSAIIQRYGNVEITQDEE
ncbi:effector-associated constant component EACC1 [Pectobacterium carotovorum]|uniref:effector-associated constant component EACC1 n=1 Tax=Pectobacterium carotovorum TaxID=554 RepID=UPI000D731FCE|nr:hypothetical protein [Pectobacterium carotovorum]PXB01120.1 hypothetical protein DMB41_16090 [Pectobacterium carotovorum subsp. carotovorum]